VQPNDGRIYKLNNTNNNNKKYPFLKKKFLNEALKMVKINIVTKKNGQQPFETDVKTTDVLSKVREELEKKNSIDDGLSFSKKFEGEYVEISRGNEDDFKLVDIIERDSNNIYIVNATTTYWKFLNKLHQLDEGWMITSEGIKRAKEKAFILQSASIYESDNVALREVTSSNNEKIGRYSFFISDSNKNFTGLLEINNKKDPPKFHVYEKARFEIDKLKPSKGFIEEVVNAIKNGNYEKFKNFTNKYGGRFIPTKIIFCSRDKNVKYCRDWDCIEFQEQKDIFHFVEADLREKIYSFLGKKILYSIVTTVSIEKGDNDDIEGNYKTKKIKLPQEVSIISKNDSCSIFATAVGMNNHYYCQILTSPDKEPELMIHYLKESSNSDKEISVGWIVIGYDLYLQHISSDKLDISRKNYISYDESDNKTFEFLDLSNYYCVGIPTVEKEDLLIGHYFSVDYKELRTFAYSLKEGKCVKLPTFSFDVLFIPKPDQSVPDKKIYIPFEKENIIVEKEFKKFPKFISLYSDKSEYKQILLNQRLTKIKVQFLDNTNSPDDLKYSFFIPFKKVFLLYFVVFLL
jgi:hypothetical protein